MVAVSVTELVGFRTGFSLALVVTLIALRGVVRLVCGPLAVLVALLDVTTAGLERAITRTPENAARLRLVRIHPNNP